MAETERTLVKRSDKVAFLGCLGSGSSVTFNRMRGFTSLSQSKNPTEYSRRYVDEDYDQTDVTGYTPSYGFGFDQYKGDPVHEEIVDILDNEKLGTDAVRDVVVVDFSQPASKPADGYVAVKRSYAIIGDTEGDSTDAYTYSGNLRVKGERIVGTATVDEAGQEATFKVASTEPTNLQTNQLITNNDSQENEDIY